MSFFRKHVRGLLRQTFSKNGAAELDAANSDDYLEQYDEPAKEAYADSAFIYERILNGKHGKKTNVPEIYSGKTGLDLPCINLDALDKTFRAAYTGPDGGLMNVQQMKAHPIAKLANLDDEFSLSSCSDDEDDLGLSESHPFASARLAANAGGSLESLGFCSDDLMPGSATDKVDWDDFCEDRAYGLSVSLYERHPISGMQAGVPIADVFGVLARRNNAVMALADGVNWGEGARLAARCAIRGAFDHLNAALEEQQWRSTTDVFHSLLGAFHTAHALILQEGGALTTLCVALVAPVRNSSSFALCVCNVGDSLCFVRSARNGVREVTHASHEVQHRNMRDAGGALGPVDGRNPQLHNLTCSMTFVEEDDLVFITSDGISDNFDPVVGKFCVIKKEETEKENDADLRNEIAKIKPIHKSNTSKRGSNKRCAAVLPCVDPAERQELMLLRMSDVISNGIGNLKESFAGFEEEQSDETRDSSATASVLCNNLVNFAYNLSAAKRKTLEDPELYRTRTHSKTEERLRRKMIRNMVMEMPGKLDHASVVAYKVGVWKERTRRAKPTPRSGPSERINGVFSASARPTLAPPPVPNQPSSRNSQINCLVKIQKPIQNVNSSATVLQTQQSARSRLVLRLDLPPELQNEDCPIPRPRAKSPYEEMPIPAHDQNGNPTQAVLRSEQKRQRKHGRGSALRHTLGVDVTWLKRLVINKHFSPNSTEQDRPPPCGSTDAVDEGPTNTMSAETPCECGGKLPPSANASPTHQQLYHLTPSPKPLHHCLSQGVGAAAAPPARLHPTQSNFSLRKLKKFVRNERQNKFSAQNDTFL